MDRIRIINIPFSSIFPSTNIHYRVAIHKKIPPLRPFLVEALQGGPAHRPRDPAKETFGDWRKTTEITECYGNTIPMDPVVPS